MTRTASGCEIFKMAMALFEGTLFWGGKGKTQRKPEANLGGGGLKETHPHGLIILFVYPKVYQKDIGRWDCESK